MSLLRNLTISLLQYEKIKTTEARAKEIRRIADKLLAVAQAKDLSARRYLLSFLYNDAKTVDKVFTTLMSRYAANKRSGFTRIIKLGNRLGDNSPLVQIELV